MFPLRTRSDATPAQHEASRRALEALAWGAPYRNHDEEIQAALAARETERKNVDAPQLL